MFDAKSLIENVFGAADPRQGTRGGSLEEMLGGLLGQAGGREQPPPNAASVPPVPPAAAQTQKAQTAPPPPASDPADSTAQTGEFDLSRILASLQGPNAPSGGLADTLRNVLGQAVQGTHEGATRIGDAVGAKDILGHLGGGKSGEDVLAQIKTIIAENKLATGAMLGGLGTLVLGTRTGRSAAVGAAKLGALALIGGLAYKAYQNYRQGQSPSTVQADAVTTTPAPAGSGFEPAAISNESAALYLRTMIAAAAADGRVDDAERAKILSNIQDGGLDADAADFLARELNKPATVDDIAAAVRSPEEASRVYAAARLAIDPDTEGEKAYLAALAHRLQIDDGLAQHIDTTANEVARAA